MQRRGRRLPGQEAGARPLRRERPGLQEAVWQPLSPRCRFLPKVLILEAALLQPGASLISALPRREHSCGLTAFRGTVAAGGAPEAGAPRRASTGASSAAAPEPSSASMAVGGWCLRPRAGGSRCGARGFVPAPESQPRSVGGGRGAAPPGQRSGRDRPGEGECRSCVPASGSAGIQGCGPGPRMQGRGEGGARAGCATQERAGTCAEPAPGARGQGQRARAPELPVTRETGGGLPVHAPRRWLLPSADRGPGKETPCPPRLPQELASTSPFGPQGTVASGSAWNPAGRGWARRGPSAGPPGARGRRRRPPIGPHARALEAQVCASVGSAPWGAGWRPLARARCPPTGRRVSLRPLGSGPEGVPRVESRSLKNMQSELERAREAPEVPAEPVRPRARAAGVLGARTGAEAGPRVGRRGAAGARPEHPQPEGR